MILSDTLQQALAQLNRPVRVSLPEVPRCVDAMRRATAGLVDGGEPIAPEHIDRLVARFRNSARSGDFSSLSLKDWRNVAWGLWLEPEPLAENETFLSQLFERLRSNGRALCRTLIIAWLHAFDPTKNSIRRIGKELRMAVARFDWDWADRAQRYALFDPDRGPIVLETLCIESKTPLAECLAEVGIIGSRRFCGIEAAAFAHSLARLGRCLASADAAVPGLLDRVLAWAVNDHALAFPGQKAQLANALLLPWHEREPSDQMREQITEFLLRFLKDPRIEPINWHGVDEAALRVIRRWLTRGALEQFLQIVDKVANREQWRYRRAFWMAYYEAGLIDEAWVLFGPAAERLGKWSLRELSGYGRILNPRRKDHCILLMRFAGDLIVAEVSHVGKSRIWLPGRREAPSLYRQKYRLSDIENTPDIEVVHQGSERVHWQREIAAFLASHAGLRVPEAKFRAV